MIDESTEQTTAEFMTHSSPNAPMCPRPNARDMKLLCELTNRRLNAAMHPPMEPPETLQDTVVSGFGGASGIKLCLRFLRVPAEVAEKYTLYRQG